MQDMGNGTSRGSRWAAAWIFSVIQHLISPSFQTAHGGMPIIVYKSISPAL